MQYNIISKVEMDIQDICLSEINDRFVLVIKSNHHATFYNVSSI